MTTPAGADGVTTPAGGGGAGPDAVIRVRGLTKSYGSLEAVRGIDLEVHRGEVFALLGPNGAGKTTTVEIMEGYRRRSGGTVEVLGVDPTHAHPEWRARIGIVLQSTGAFEELTVREVITHFSRFYPNPLPPEEVIERVGLSEKATSRCGKLSGGQQRRLDVALGIIGDPELVFLDEPTTGLDPQARRRAWALVEDMISAGKTVLLTTHYLEEAEALADRVAIITAGRIVAEGTPRELGGRDHAPARVTFEAKGPLAGAPLPVLDGAQVEISPADVVLVRTDQPTTVVAALHTWAGGLGAGELPGLTVSRPTLEDTYLRLIAEHAQGGPETAEVEA